MRSAKILFKNDEAGILTQHDDGSFTFHYHESWIENPSKPSISATLPKKNMEYSSKYLFPFFYHLLPEGSNKQVVCKYNNIDPNDDFGILLSIAKNDTIGAIRVINIDEE